MDIESGAPFQLLLELLRRLTDDDVDTVAVPVDDMPVSLRRRMIHSGFELVLQTAGTPDLTIGVMYPPRADRPPEYPAHLPFAAHHLVAILMPGSPEGQCVVWFRVPDEAGLTSRITNGLRTSGWTVLLEREVSRTGDVLFRSTFERGRDQRTLVTVRSTNEQLAVILVDYSRTP